MDNRDRNFIYFIYIPTSHENPRYKQHKTDNFNIRKQVFIDYRHILDLALLQIPFKLLGGGFHHSTILGCFQRERFSLGLFS
jgi:hypothetical protein